MSQSIDNKLQSKLTSLLTWSTGLLTTRHEIPGSFPGHTVGIFPHR
jgi:hypothetical protein